MTSRTRRRFRVTLLTLCSLLLAQWTLATHACPVIWQAGDLIIQAQVAAEAAAQDAQDCHGGKAVLLTGDSPVCVKHCVDEGSANNGNGAVAMFAAPPFPHVVRALLPADAGPLQWRRAPDRGDATAPPLSILYCVSLT